MVRLIKITLVSDGTIFWIAVDAIEFIVKDTDGLTHVVLKGMDGERWRVKETVEQLVTQINT